MWLKLLAPCLFFVLGSMAMAGAEPVNLNGKENLGALHASAANGDYEYAVVAVIEAVQAGSLTLALELVDAHLKDFPRSRVGYFLRGDILSSMVQPLAKVGDSQNINVDALEGFKHQILNRWKHAKLSESDTHALFPSSLVHIGEHPYIMVADMPEGRLYLYANVDGKPRLLRDYYMSVGSQGYGKEFEGDNKTPIGLYEINRYIEGPVLPDLYGKGAFPVNYPNRYDRFLKRTGYGIWLHGTPSDTYARPPWASEGCFVLSNDDLLDIGKYVSADLRTPVILSDRIEWLSAKQLDEKRKQYFDVLEVWKGDWENLDIQAYMAHYQAKNFNLGSGNYSAWRERKSSVNRGKTFVQLDFELESLFAYPGVEDMFVVKFKQRYLSNDFSGESRKEQYWKRDSSGTWRIIYEG